jgi:hypothetical protein
MAGLPSNKQITDRMLFPIGRSAVDTSRVDVTTDGLGKSFKSWNGYVAGQYGPFDDRITMNPIALENGAEQTLSHEFRHRANRDEYMSPWKLAGSKIGLRDSPDRRHEKITVLDLMEAKSPGEFDSMLGYNNKFSQELDPYNQSKPVRRGNDMMDYLNEQKPWIVESSVKAAEKLGLPLKPGETHAQKYQALADKLTNRAMTRRSVRPGLVTPLEDIKDPRYRRYNAAKRQLGKRMREIGMPSRKKVIAGRAAQQDDPRFRSDLTRPGPTQAAWDWDTLGKYTPRN